MSSLLLLLLLLPSSSSSSPNPSCHGSRIFLHPLPPSFNSLLLLKCFKLITPWLNFCPHVSHHGLGLALPPSSPLGPFWHRTDAYMLEVIFHSRMRSYPCLTYDPDLADAFFVPYYTGLDALHYLYRSDSRPQSPHGWKLVSWLEQNAREQWERYGGRDHFLIMGRTPWDFVPANRQWGTGIFEFPHYANMTALLIEKQPWMPNQQAVPYPTSFHPSPHQLQQWSEKARSAERPSLFAFAGSIRPHLMKGGIRDILLKQCIESSRCALLDCKKSQCSHNPEPIISTFLRSEFCLQPRGDTPTRRSLFDSIISGCIPVLFHQDTAYTQYTWHLPEVASKWSVYIPEDEIRQGASVEEALRSISPAQVGQMRETVINLIPNLIYVGMSDEANNMDGVRAPDAFDVSVQHVLKRVASMKQQLRGDER